QRQAAPAQRPPRQLLDAPGGRQRQTVHPRPGIPALLRPQGQGGMMRTRLLPAFFVLFALSASAADWPQWRGPNRDGVSKETGLLKNWPKKGPKLVWKTDKAGLGFAGPAVIGGTVYTMGAFDKNEYVIAFDAKGKELWKTKIGGMHDFEGNTWIEGPNTTPTV